jgi:TRAP-type C4-dicarboxylate transport system permease small subunit
MILALRTLLVMFGVSCVLISLSILLVGPELVQRAFENVYAALGGPNGQGEHWAATMDSELRFYAALFGAYGLIVLRVAARLPAEGTNVVWLAAVLFVGGIGRAISRWATGVPSPIFMVLMAIELMLPLIFVLLWFFAITLRPTLNNP